ncbi:hypothetical protein BH09MYX1_BH09MYX1_37350 [soil metagenome]
MTLGRIFVAGAFLSVALAAQGCGSRTGLGTSDGGPAIASFPVGTFAHCAEGLYTEDGNVFLRSAGVAPDATLTVVQKGSALTALYIDSSKNTSFQTFSVATATAATLAPAGQTTAGFEGLCVQGIGFNNEIPFAASITDDAGSLTYNRGAMIMTLHGELSGDGGPCGRESTTATRWVVCDQGPPAAVQPSTGSVPFASMGDFACASQIGTDLFVNGQRQIVASGGAGELTVKEVGDRVVAVYSGDSSVTGMVRFTGATDAIANLDTTESTSARCEVPITTTGTNGSAGAFDVASASMMREGSSLVVVLSGGMDGATSCAGARKAIALVCTER